MAANEQQVAEEVRALAVILTDEGISKERIQERVVALSNDDLPKVVIRARTVQGYAKYLIDCGEQEMRLRAQVDDGTQTDAVKPGSTWVDKGTGVVHKFEGELSDWKVADPAGLRNALSRLARVDGSRWVEDVDIERAVVATYKPNHNVLNELAKRGEDVATVINSFRKKDRGPAHLKEDKP